MRNVIVLLIFVLMTAGSTLAQEDEDCLVFTNALLDNGGIVAANTPAAEDDSEALLGKFTALQPARQFLIDSLREPVPCHEEPALNLLDATIGYQDYVTLRLGQKLVKDAPSISERLASTLEAANSDYGAYDIFWNPPDA